MLPDDNGSMKVSSKNVHSWTRATAEILIPEDEAEQIKAKLELLLVVKHNEGYSDATLDQIKEINGKYIFNMGTEMHGYGLNPLVYENLVDVNDLIDDEIN